MKPLVYVAAFVLFCALFAGCGDSIMVPTQLPTDPATCCKLLPKPEPTAEPTPEPQKPAPDVPYGAGTTTAQGLCKDIQQGVSCLVLAYTRDRALVLVTNSSAAGQVVSMESYSLGIPDEFSTQTVVDALEATFPAGASGTLEVRLPPCGYQVDVHLGLKVNFPPHPLHSLLGFEKVGTACAPPVPDPPVVPPVTPPIPPVTPDPPIRPIPPKPPVETDCRTGTVNMLLRYDGATVTPSFDVLANYRFRLWFATYRRNTDGWDDQTFIDGIPPETYTAGHYVLRPLRTAGHLQGDSWCDFEDLYGQDVTPNNFDRFNQAHDFFTHYVLGSFAARAWR